MITKQAYELMKSKYSMYSSWAIWKPETQGIKSNIADMSWLDDPSLLSTLGTRFVFINYRNGRPNPQDGLTPVLPWTNFHSKNPYGNDFKLRYAFTNTRYWGSYMSAIVKTPIGMDYDETSILLNNPFFIKQCLSDLKQEVSCLGKKNLVLVAMKAEAFSLLHKHFDGEYQIASIRNFAYHISKEQYRIEVLNSLSLF